VKNEKKNSSRKCENDKDMGFSAIGPMLWFHLAGALIPVKALDFTLHFVIMYSWL
jgi:hypothetical protein